MAGIHLRLGARLGHAPSASAAVGSAVAFTIVAALLSFVPDAPERRQAAWALRGTLPAESLTETGIDRAPARDAAGLQARAKPV